MRIKGMDVATDTLYTLTTAARDNLDGFVCGFLIGVHTINPFIFTTPTPGGYFSSMARCRQWFENKLLKCIAKKPPAEGDFVNLLND